VENLNDIAEPGSDPAMIEVADAILAMDPEGERFAQVFRDTFDQLYDGQRTGRYRWDQLFKTEKTHFGTLIEINLQRTFHFADGKKLDYSIAGHDVDCKYSAKEGGWMLPPESFGELALVATASNEAAEYSVGLVRVSDANRRNTYNRDGKTTLTSLGRLSVRWLYRNVGMPPNVLLQMPQAAVEQVYFKKAGQQRLDELLRVAHDRRIHRSTIATVTQQHDYMKRVRYNGGSRSNLRPEGFLIPGGDYAAHRAIAAAFGVVVPQPGEVVSFRVTPTDSPTALTVQLEGKHWRTADPNEIVLQPAPLLPNTARGVRPSGRTADREVGGVL
jgi:Restriction endonuclease NaeI